MCFNSSSCLLFCVLVDLQPTASVSATDAFLKYLPLAKGDDDEAPVQLDKAAAVVLSILDKLTAPHLTERGIEVSSSVYVYAAELW